MAIAISEQQRADLVPQLTGEVIHAFEVEGKLSNLFTITPLNGSDTKIDRVAGKARVDRVDWTEVDKSAQVGVFGKVEYKVENSIYIRHAEENIAPLLQDVDGMKELGMEHGKALAIQRDVTILTALLVGSRADAMAVSGVAGVAPENDLDKVIEAGLHYVMLASGDINDVSKVEEGLEQLITAMQANRRLDAGITTLACSWKVYRLLRHSDKLISRDYSDTNGDYAKGIVARFLDIPVMPITTFQDLQGFVGTTNSAGDTWNAEAVDGEARAVIFSPMAIRVLEVMPVVVDAWYEKLHKTNYIDSQAFYGVGVRRQDKIGALYTFLASDTATVGAGNEITTNIDTVITVV